MRRADFLAPCFAAAVLFCGLGHHSPARAQEEPAEKPPAKLDAADPFGNEAVKDEDRGEHPRGGHQIRLQEPAAPGMSLEERLMLKGTLQATEAPLHELAEALAAELDAPVVISAKKLEEAAINVQTPVTYRLKNVKMQVALKLILDELGLTYLAADDIIVITTPEDAGSRLITRVYDCRELMKLPSPVKKVKQPAPANPGGGIGTPEIPAQAPEKKKEEVGPDGGYDITDLMHLITTTVAPDTWDEVGGPGSLADFKGLVTVSTTQDVHDQVEKLLNMLHKAGGLEEKVKVSR